MPNKTVGKQKPFRIGLIGEDPNDTDATAALLLQRYAEQVQFVKIGQRLKGNRLDNRKALGILREEYEEKQPDVVIVIRDLDALASDDAKMKIRRDDFEKVNQVVGGAALFLLHIYEMEALIAADPPTFNAHYNAAYKPPADVMRIVDPKGKLRDATRNGRKTYHPSHAAELLAKVDYDKLLARCRYFAAFDKAFRARLP
jgi:hypothetical protein